MTEACGNRIPITENPAYRDIFDRRFYRQRLLGDAHRLFTNNESSIELWTVDFKTKDVPATSHTVLTSEHSVTETLQLSEKKGLNLVFVLKQKSSWDRLLLSRIIAEKILCHFDVFPPFLDHVHSFGFKVDERGEGLHGFLSRREASAERKVLDSEYRRSFELCYCVRYPEMNSHSEGSPWSIRQTAVYQKYDAGKDSTVWIIIQPSQSFKSQLPRLVPCRGDGLCLLNTTLLLYSNRFWRDYIIYLRNETKELENKALLAKVGKTSRYDCSIAFRDSQLLQRRRKKLLEAQSILKINVRVAKRYVSFLNHNIDKSIEDLEIYMHQVKDYRVSIDEALETSKATVQTLFQILKYRNDEVIAKTNKAIDTNSRNLSELVAALGRATEGLTELTTKSQKDTHAVKILTIVAAFYLPATLVASVFNSNLLQRSSSSEVSDSKTDSQLVPAPNFWMFPIFTIVLMVLTLGPAGIWVRYSVGRI